MEAYGIHIGDHIGGGAGGEVYECKAALKYIPILSGINYNLEKYQRELSMMREVDHRNVVRLYHADIEMEQKFAYIIMEYVDGETLEQKVQNFHKDINKGFSSRPTVFLEENRVPAKIIYQPDSKISSANASTPNKFFPFGNQQLLNYLIQAATGLESLHKKKIIHRDIKPLNILISKAGIVKICDFGMAKYEKAKRLRNTHMKINGTPYYMPPEQMENDDEKISYQSDIYSLGATFYWVITHKCLFEDYLTDQFRQDNIVYIDSKHYNQIQQENILYMWAAQSKNYSLAIAEKDLYNAKTKVIQKLNRKEQEIIVRLDESIQKVLLKMLNPDPEQRYTNSSELLEYLKQIESSYSSS